LSYFLSVLVINPEGGYELKEVPIDKMGIVRELGIAEEDLSELRDKTYSVFFPAYINIRYCLESSKFPTKIIVVSVHNVDSGFGLDKRYKLMTEDDAFNILEKLNLKKEFLDKRIFPSDTKSLNQSIYGYITHDRRISFSAKGICSLLLMHDFQLSEKELTYYIKEDQDTINLAIQELVKKKIIKKLIGDNGELCYFIHHEYLEEVRKTYTKFYDYFEPSHSKGTPKNDESFSHPEVNSNDRDDTLIEEAIALVTEMQTASVSMLQRRFRIGYTRAARIIDELEQLKIVGPYEGSKPRTVLTDKVAEEG
jgi:hypothetical protein